MHLILSAARFGLTESITSQQLCVSAYVRGVSHSGSRGTAGEYFFAQQIVPDSIPDGKYTATQYRGGISLRTGVVNWWSGQDHRLGGGIECANCSAMGCRDASSSQGQWQIGDF